MERERIKILVNIKSPSFRSYKANMPNVGAQYVLFLKCQDKDHAYHLLTAYELRGGKVFPLDALPQFRAHQDSDVQTFQTQLSAALAPAPKGLR